MGMDNHNLIQRCDENTKVKGQPLYMFEIMSKANDRKIEQSILKECREVRYLQNEDKLYGIKKSYVSLAYKNKLKNDIEWLTNSKEHKIKKNLNNSILFNTYSKGLICHNNHTNWIKESKNTNTISKNISIVNNNKTTFESEEEKKRTGFYLKIPEMTEKIKSARTRYFDRLNNN